MKRREVLLGAGAAAMAAAAQAVFAAQDHSQHMHGGGKYAALAAAAGNCVRNGQLCIDHCFDLLGQGDKSMAACARSANQMMAVCATLQQLAAQNSKFLAKYAKVAMEVCKDCEEECRKHLQHQPCKDCADSCAACGKECKIVSGSA